MPPIYKDMPTECPLEHLSPCELDFSNMGTTEKGEEVYIYVCHSHQHGIMRFTKILGIHDDFDNYDFDNYDGLSDEFDMAFVPNHDCDSLRAHNMYYFGEYDR